MEEIEETSSEFEGEEGAENFRVEPRTENAKQIDGPAMVVTLPAATAPPTSAAVPGMKVSKKRGRPRKAGHGGVALSPMPISASIPLNGEFSAWERGKGASVDTVMKKHKVKHEGPGTNFELQSACRRFQYAKLVHPVIEKKNIRTCKLLL